MTDCTVNYKVPPEVIQFKNKEDLFRHTAEELKAKLNKKSSRNEQLTLALSGGSSPIPLYDLLAREYNDMEWDKLQLFWVDERMVRADDPESNYGNIKKVLLDHIPLPSSNIHFINGAKDPRTENEKYSLRIRQIIQQGNDLPAFDLIWLGIGSDGHTASIFPGAELSYSTGISAVAGHPLTKQKRITLTEDVINNASEIIFIVSGSDKESVVSKILSGEDMLLPAARIAPMRGKLKWYLAF